MARLSTRVAYNTIWQVGSKVITTILNLAALALITRYLGQRGFGQYTIAVTFASFFAVLADMGLTLVTVQMINNFLDNRSKILNNLFSLRLVSALILLTLAPLVALFFPYEGIVKIGIAVYAFSLLFVALNQILVGLFQQELRMDRVSLAEIFGRIIFVLAVVIVIRNDYSLLGIIIANLIAGGINFFLLYFFSRRFSPIRLAYDQKIWRDIISRSWPLAITITLNLLYLRSDTLMLSVFKSQSDVGLYGAAYRVIDVLTTIPYMFVGLILPILTAGWVQGNKEYFQKILQRSFDLLAIIVVPLVVGTQFTATEIMTLIAGEEFRFSGTILKILIFAELFIFISCILAHALIAMNRQKNLIPAYIFVSLTTLAGYLIFIPRFSFYGAAGMTIYSEAAITVAFLYYLKKFSQTLPRFKVFFKTMIASALMALYLYLIPRSLYTTFSNLILIIASASIIYFFGLFFLKGLTKEDLKILTVSRK